MNYLSKQFNAQERVLVQTELERLFLMNDRAIDEKKIAFLLREIQSMGAPASAVIKGLKSLHDADLRSIKFSVIKRAIFDHYEIKYAKEDCIYCDGLGVVRLIDRKKATYAFACCCSNGKRYEHLNRWSGAIVDGDYALYERYLLGREGCVEWLKQKIEEIEQRKAGDYVAA